MPDTTGDDERMPVPAAPPFGEPCVRLPDRVSGTMLPALIDHHVHTHLIDLAALGRGGIAEAVDLGGDPAVLAVLSRDRMPALTWAGAFLTAPGGYPSDRAWAPPGTWRAVTDPSSHPGVAGGAVTAVDEQAAFGASVIKVALHADAAAVLSPELLDAIVATAHARGLPVVAHVEGADMTERALDAGVDALAHTPFTERLADAVVARAVDAGQAWVSTLTIHTGDDAGRAARNLTAFAAAGGRVLYGTDLGNGDRVPGIRPEEVAALDAVLAAAALPAGALLAALTDPWPHPARTARGVATFIPGPAPAARAAIPDWLAAAVIVPREELEPDDR